MIDRHKRILEALSEQGRSEVTALADALGVSQVTMRKDLAALERLGLVRRAHGFASLGAVDDISARMAYHYDDKKRIAGEVRDVTIVTNSAFIAGYVRNAPRPRVVLLGGDYQPRSQVMVGPLTRTCAEAYFVDKFFLGTDGFAPQYGFMGGDLMRTEAVRAMMAQARRAVILTDSSKFSRQGVVSQMAFSEVGAVVTDGGIPGSAQAALAAHGVKTIIV